MDFFTNSVLILIFGLAALVSGVLVLGSLVWQRRVAPVPAVCGAVSVAVVIACMVTLPPGYSQAERDRVAQLHAAFAPALERYRQAHGDYPPTLEAAGIKTRPRRSTAPCSTTASAPARARRSTPSRSATTWTTAS